MGWSGARLLLEFSVQPCMFFFLAFCRTCLTELCSFVYTCGWKDDSFTNEVAKLSTAIKLITPQRFTKKVMSCRVGKLELMIGLVSSFLTCPLGTQSSVSKCF